jgi:2-methylcitrate dehydratase PrpD
MEKVGKPLELWTNPQVDAQFSIPYTVAVALSRGEVVLDDFEADKFKNPAVLQLAERIKCIPKQDLQGRTPVTLEIKTKTGKMFSKTVHIMRGEPGRPLTYEQRLRKFRSCCRSAAKPLVNDKMDALIRSVDRLEKLNNVNELVELLT